MRTFGIGIAWVIFFLSTSTGFADAEIYHPNGERAWSGSRGGEVYHQNGKRAWNGSRGGEVYHQNGERAWNGSKGGTAYHENGTILTSSADGVVVHLGPGIDLQVSIHNAYLVVYGKQILHSSWDN